MKRLVIGFVSRFLRLLGGHELAVLLGFAAILSGIWLFGWIAAEVTDGGSQALDRRLLLSMRRPGDLKPVGPPFLQDAARDVTALGGPTVLALLTLFTGGFLFLSGKKHMGFLVYGSVGSGLLLSTVLKDFFNRPRPDIAPHDAYVITSSFPSGHSMLSAITYLTLGALLARSYQRKRLKAYFLLVAGLLTCLIGISRVYLGVHWPTDVLAGWTAGTSWSIAFWLLARRLQRRHAIEVETQFEAEEQ